MRGSRAARWKPRKAGRGAEQTVAVPFYYHPDAPTPAPSQHSRGARGSTKGACGNPGNGWDGGVGAGKIHRFQSSGPREPPDAQDFSAQAYKTARPHALRAV